MESIGTCEQRLLDLSQMVPKLTLPSTCCGCKMNEESLQKCLRKSTTIQTEAYAAGFFTGLQPSFSCIAPFACFQRSFERYTEITQLHIFVVG